MDHHTNIRLVCLLLMFTSTISASSFDLGLDDYFDDKDVPEDIRKYLAIFEGRILRAVDNEFKRQLRMIRARIDHRIPSLLDLTLKDKIDSGFINKAMDDALINRVEKLEEITLIRGHAGKNTTRLDEANATLHDSDNKLQTGNTETASAPGINTAAIRRLDSEVKKIQSALLTMDSKVNGLTSNITADIRDAESLHLMQQNDLDGIKSELRILNSSFARIDSDVTNFVEDIQNMKSELMAARNNDSVIVSELQEIRTALRGIDLTVNKTLSDVTDSKEEQENLKGNLIQIGYLSNTTTMRLEEIQTEMVAIRSSINHTNEATNEVILYLNTTLLSIKDSGNLTAFHVEELKSEIQTVQSSALDMADTRETIQNLKDELAVLLKRDNTTSQKLKGLAFKLQSVESAITQTGVHSTEIERDINDLETKVIHIKKNVTTINLSLDIFNVGMEAFGTTLNKTISDVGNINDRLNTMDEKMTGEVLSVIQLGANNTGVVQNVKREIRILREKNTHDLREIKNQLLDFDARFSKMASSSTGNKHEISVTKSELATIQQNVTRLVSNVVETTLEMRRISNELNETTENLGETKSEMSVVTSQLDSTRSAVTNNTKAIKTVQSELPAIRLKVDKASSDTRVNGNSIASAQSTLSSFSNQLNTVKSGIAQLRMDVKFEVRLPSSSKTVSKGSVLKFDKVHYNTGSGYNSATGHFTAPVAGSYLFWANVLMYASSSSFDLTLTKNGIRIAASAATTSSSTRFDTVSLTAVTELKTGDKIYFKKSSGPTNKVFGYMFSGYGGVLIRRK